VQTAGSEIGLRRGYSKSRTKELPRYSLFYLKNEDFEEFVRWFYWSSV